MASILLTGTIRLVELAMNAPFAVLISSSAIGLSSTVMPFAVASSKIFFLVIPFNTWSLAVTICPCSEIKKKLDLGHSLIIPSWVYKISCPPNAFN